MTAEHHVESKLQDRGWVYLHDRWWWVAQPKVKTAPRPIRFARTASKPVGPELRPTPTPIREAFEANQGEGRKK